MFATGELSVATDSRISHVLLEIIVDSSIINSNASHGNAATAALTLKQHCAVTSQRTWSWAFQSWTSLWRRVVRCCIQAMEETPPRLSPLLEQTSCHASQANDVSDHLWDEPEVSDAIVAPLRRHEVSDLDMWAVKQQVI